MQSADPSYLFQSDASLRVGASRAEKAGRTREGSEWGAPIWLGHKHEDVEKLATGGAGADGGAAKVLQLIVIDGIAWTAESGGIARATDLETGECLQICRGHTAPVSSIATYRLPSGRRLLLTGSWDKSIRIWPLTPASPGAPCPSFPKALAIVTDAGSDFIKALLCLDAPSQQILVSGGSDRNVRVWDLASLSVWVDQSSDDGWDSTDQRPAAPTVPCIATMREHTRPVSVLCTIPPPPASALSTSAGEYSGYEGVPVFSADTMGRVLEARLHLARTSGEVAKARFEMRRELRGNQTGVFALSSGWRGVEEDDTDSDEATYRWIPELWTGSHDNTAQLFVLDTSAAPSPSALAASTSVRSNRDYAQVGSLPPLLSSRTITHPIYVKSLLVLAHLTQPVPGTSVPDVLVTGSTDEQIRAWDISERPALSEAPSSVIRRQLDGRPVESTNAGAQLIREVEGHWHEVTALAPWWRTGRSLLKSEVERLKLEDGQGKEDERSDWWVVSASLDGSVRRWRLSDLLAPRPPADIKDIISASTSPPPKKKAGPAMTEEEERELAELMDDSE